MYFVVCIILLFPAYLRTVIMYICFSFFSPTVSFDWIVCLFARVCVSGLLTVCLFVEQWHASRVVSGRWKDWKGGCEAVSAREAVRGM